MNTKLQIVKDDLFIYDSIPDEITLREDMYQAKCGAYTIDCGWYELDEEGSFITFIIKNADWGSPILKILTPNFSDAKWSINACKEYIESIMQ